MKRRNRSTLRKRLGEPFPLFYELPGAALTMLVVWIVSIAVLHLLVPHIVIEGKHMPGFVEIIFALLISGGCIFGLLKLFERIYRIATGTYLKLAEREEDPLLNYQYLIRAYEFFLKNRLILRGRASLRQGTKRLVGYEGQDVTITVYDSPLKAYDLDAPSTGVQLVPLPPLSGEPLYDAGLIGGAIYRHAQMSLCLAVDTDAATDNTGRPLRTPRPAAQRLSHVSDAAAYQLTTGQGMVAIQGAIGQLNKSMEDKDVYPKGIGYAICEKRWWWLRMLAGACLVLAIGLAVFGGAIPGLVYW
jgi:hypothetical protein